MYVVHAQHASFEQLPLHTYVDLQRCGCLVVGREDGLAGIADGKRVADERGIGDRFTDKSGLILLLKRDQIRRALAKRLSAEDGKRDAVDTVDCSPWDLDRIAAATYYAITEE